MRGMIADGVAHDNGGRAVRRCRRRRGVTGSTDGRTPAGHRGPRFVEVCAGGQGPAPRRPVPPPRPIPQEATTTPVFPAVPALPALPDLPDAWWALPAALLAWALAAAALVRWWRDQTRRRPSRRAAQW